LGKSARHGKRRDPGKEEESNAMPPSDESKPISDMDRSFFGPYPHDFSLLTSIRELTKEGTPHWPPLGWESDQAPRNDSLEAAKAWFEYFSHPVGPLRCRESLDRGKGRPVDWGRCVRDAWRLAKHFNALGKSKVEIRERSGRYDAHAALIELENVYNQLFPSSLHHLNAKADANDSTESGEQPPKQPGRKRKFDPKEDRETADEWQRAYAAGESKKDFAKRKPKLKTAQALNRLLNRVRATGRRRKTTARTNAPT
jgi:hypothetical protein